jgi:hypothetical protein
MPTYRVWYRDNPEPLEFTTPNRFSEAEILDRVIAHEDIVPSAVSTVKELIAQSHLAPVRYTEDESEMNTIH